MVRRLAARFGKVRRQSFESKLVAERTKAADDADGDRRHVGVMAEALAAEDVGEMHLDNRTLAGGERILPDSWLHEATSPKVLRGGTRLDYGYLWWTPPIEAAEKPRPETSMRSCPPVASASNPNTLSALEPAAA